MERKSDTVRRLVATGDYKTALKIAKSFKIGITKDDIDSMTRGYECMIYPDFYRQIGFDIHETTQKGIGTLLRLYGA